MTVRIIKVSLELARGERTVEQLPRQIAEVDTKTVGWLIPAGFYTRTRPENK
jgi:uncharacterized membrane protein YciS (DUF1049 family)